MPVLSWELSLTPEPAKRTKESLRFHLHCAGQEKRIPVVDGASLSDLEQEIAFLENRLAEIREQARQAWENLPQEEVSEPEGEAGEDPAVIWEKLKACSSQAELQEMFNALPDARRLEVAGFVLSSVNMFAGPGAFFAQNYDHHTGLLG
ncbi:MAG: hypothetical protein R6V55_01640 [Desulfovermiculus sp.]